MAVAKYFFGAPVVEDSNPEAANQALSMFENWAERNQGWAMLVVSCMMLLPTWVHFRFSPKNYQHTLPEGFFIQVFMSSSSAFSRI